MPRPRKRRRVSFEPEILFFKPRRIPLRELGTINLKVEELEALRLKHRQELSQEEAAKQMDVSRTTFARILKNAHKNITEFLLGKNSLRVRLKDKPEK